MCIQQCATHSRITIADSDAEVLGQETTTLWQGLQKKEIFLQEFQTLIQDFTHRTQCSMINMARNSSAELKFQFEKSGTYEPVTMPFFEISIYDVDQENDKYQEEFSISGYDSYYVTSTTALAITSSGGFVGAFDPASALPHTHHC